MMLTEKQVIRVRRNLPKGAVITKASYTLDYKKPMVRVNYISDKKEFQALLHCNLVGVKDYQRVL